MVIDAEQMRAVLQAQKYLGPNVLRLRSSRDWSATDLATHVNVDRQTILDIESGTTVFEPDLLSRLADTLGTTEAALIASRYRLTARY